MLHIWPKAACRYHHFLPLEFTESARQLKQLESLVEGDTVHRFVGRKRGKQRFIGIVGGAYLHQRPESANLHRYHSSAYRVVAQYSLAHTVFETQIGYLLHAFVERLVEVCYLVLPAQFALGNLVETLLDAGSEVIVHDVGEILLEEVVNHTAGVGRDKLSLLGTHIFGEIGC